LALRDWQQNCIVLHCPDVSRAKVKTNMRRMLPLFLLAAALPAFADIVTITASLTRPVAGPGLDVYAVQPTVKGTGNFSGIGYFVTFNGLPGGQGVVQGALSGKYAIPVAGQIDLADAFLTGGYNSALTTDIPPDLPSGMYFSTGETGTIDIHFYASQHSLALLWGSIDPYNSLSFAGGENTVTLGGADVPDSPDNGTQTFKGSSWVVITPGFEFNDVTFSSTSPSFEFAGVAGFSVPEPSAVLLLAVMGGVLLALISIRKRLA
jgi:hypothetical protein